MDITENLSDNWLKNNFISGSKLAEILAVSEATIRNWIKSGKISSDFTQNSIYYFSKNNVQNIINNIRSGKINTLKSRRNKKHINGNSFYNDYIPTNSKNLQSVQKIIKIVSENKIPLTKNEIQYIVANCATQLLIHKNNLTKFSNNFFMQYLNSNIDFGQYNCFINDLIDNKTCAQNFIKKYPQIFEVKFSLKKNEDVLGLLYISLFDLRERKAKGSYYTPTNVIQNLIGNLHKEDFLKKNIMDPCCGSGNFLLQLPDNLLLENIFGNDIDEIAIKIARLNMILKFAPKNSEILYKNFTNKNFLCEKFPPIYDYIIGNPPWGAEFSPSEIDLLNRNFEVAQGNNIESFDLFVEQSLKILKLNAILSFVLPQSILNVKKHYPIRKIITKSASIKYIEYLGEIFDKVQCPSIILQLKNTKTAISCIGTTIKKRQKSFVINYEREICPEFFNFAIDDEEYTILKKLTDKNNKIYLKNNAIFALGVVTGNNTKFLSDNKSNTNEPILKGTDIKKYKIDAPKNFIEFNPKNLQQVAPVQIYRANEKLIYKFISKNLSFAFDNNKTLVLNSCNILIPTFKDYDIKYILAVLNSNIAQFIFEKTYNSVKVLRSHLENIPIPKCPLNTQKEIVEIVNNLINENDNNFLYFYNLLEAKIQQLYGLTQDEYKIIYRNIMSK